MKRLNRFMHSGAVAITALFFVNCTHEDVGDTTSSELVAIYSPDTRTSYSYNAGTNFAWDNDDKIRLAFSNSAGDLSSLLDAMGNLEPYTDRTRAKVTYSVPASGMKRNFFATYPYDRTEFEYAYEDIYLQVTLNDTFEPGDWSTDFCPIPMFAINNEESNSLLFEHLCGLLRVNCQNVPARTKKLKISSLNSNSLAGIMQFVWLNTSQDWYFDGIYHTGNDIQFKLADAISSPCSIVLNVPVNVFSESAVSRNYGVLKVTALDASDNQLGSRYFDMGVALGAGQGCMRTIDFASTTTCSFSLNLGGTLEQDTRQTSGNSSIADFIRNESLVFIEEGSLVNYTAKRNQYITLCPGIYTYDSNAAILQLKFNTEYQYKGPLTIKVRCESEGTSTLRILTNAYSGVGTGGTNVSSADGITTIEANYDTTYSTLDRLRLVVPGTKSNLKIYSIEIVFR